MLWDSRVKFLLLLCLVTGIVHKSSQNRCDLDEVCKDVETCDEAMFFISRNVDEIQKLRVCGSKANTKDYCCKMAAPRNTPGSSSLSAHRNIKLINHAKCGKANIDKITGGSVANIGSLPWMALLQYQDNDGVKSFKCGGSLISPKYVLTAAHCAKVRQQTLISVRLGEHRISTESDCPEFSDSNNCRTDDPPYQDIEIESQIVHEDYVNRLRNDIALLRLKTAAILGLKIKGVSTICLPVKLSQTVEAVMEEEADLNELNIAGWGFTEENQNSISDVLMQASIPFVSNDKCIESYQKLKSRAKVFPLDITDGHLCAGGHNKTDACNGDSGGPLTSPAQNDNGNYKFFQQGIVMQGVSCSSAEVSPGIYTRVFHYMRWILDNLED